MKTAEEIVRAMAENEPIEYGDDESLWHGCILCKVSLTTSADDHAPTCPYRMAVEWVAAHAQEKTV